VKDQPHFFDDDIIHHPSPITMRPGTEWLYAMESISEDKTFDDEVCGGLSSEHQTLSSCQVQGVVFSKSVRSTFCSFHVALDQQQHQQLQDGAATNGNEYDVDNAEVILVRIQFPDKVHVRFRSHCRRFYKLGDLIGVYQGTWTKEESKLSDTNDWQPRKLVAEPMSLQDLETSVKVEEARLWNMTKCQKLQHIYCNGRSYWTPSSSPIDAPGPETVCTKPPPIWTDHPKLCNTDASPCGHHGGGIEKREQAKYVARFLVHMTMNRLLGRHHQQRQKPVPHGETGSIEYACMSLEPSLWATTDPRCCDQGLFRQAVEYLNRGTGVLDAAGGSGHVSMQLGLLGVRSTVVDPREAVGKLPGRDRKIWTRALNMKPNSDDTDLYCQPVEFNSWRGWFGPRLDGVDTAFRHPDQAVLPVCDSTHDTFLRCTAIIALHPDEATEAIVNMAVAGKKLLVVVPCCVFFRLFPHRKKPGTDDPVSTHNDLLTYLEAKDAGIERSTLPFQGANTVLYNYS
jgi:hypothetical protein